MMDTAENAEEARKLIDEQISQLEAETPKEALDTSKITSTRNSQSHNSILQLKYQRNAYAPIFNLPDEILIQICLIFRGPSGGWPKAWHKVAHICRHWRTVVVSAPTLWTEPPDSLPEYALLMLERSKLSPLHISVFRPHNLPTFLAHMRRIQVLALTLDPASLDIAQKIVSSLNEEASLLKELFIKSIDGRLSPGLGLPTPKFKFSLSAFRPTDSLRKLVLRVGVEFDWRIFPLPSLTHLSLMDASVASAVSGYQFADALSRMPCLETLVLSFGGIQLSDYPSEASRSVQINLPRLIKLDIQPRSPRSQVQSFLSQAFLPQLQRLKTDWESGADVTDFRWHSGMLRQVSVSIDRGDFGILDELEIFDQGFTLRPHLEDWQLERAAGVEELPYVHVLLPFQQYDHHRNGAVIEEIIVTLASRTSVSDFSSLVRVCIISDIDVTVNQFIRLFASLPTLEVIGVSSSLVRLLTEALTITSNHSPDNPAPFLTLHSIEWYDVGTMDPDWESVWTEGSDVPGEMDDEELEEFCDCLMQRYEYGFPIDRLEMVGCYISYKQLKFLQGILVTVD